MVPVFNESSSWQKEYWVGAVKKPDVSWIFVNDASSDNSQALIEEICSYENVTLVNHEINLGKAEAIRTGFNLHFNRVSDNERQEFIGYLDSDGAFNLEEVERIKQLVLQDPEGLFRNGFESIWSARVKLNGRSIKRKKHRHFIGRLIVSTLSLAYPGIPYDPQSGYKIFLSSPNLIEIFKHKFKSRWFVDLEIYTRFEKISGKKLRIWEEPLNYWRDIGDSSLRLKNGPRVVVELCFIFRELVKIHK